MKAFPISDQTLNPQYTALCYFLLERASIYAEQGGPMNRRRIRWRGAQDECGQSLLELALCLPVFCFLLLAAVDFARAYSVEKRLEQGAHSAALLTVMADPSYSDTDVASYIAIQAGLPSGTVTAAKTYSADTNGNNHVTITAAYGYPLLFPGLRSVQAGGIANGKLGIGVQATGIAPTDPPLLTHSCPGTTCQIVVKPNTGATGTPSGLENLVCTIYENGAPKRLTPDCSGANPLNYPYTEPCPVSSCQFTATITQADGVVSQSSSPWTAP
jgi:hypothetical protein